MYFCINILKIKIMIETKLSDNPNFEPSHECKQLFLKTRKIEKDYGPYKFPGYFIVDEEKYNWDGFMSIIIFLLECVGIGMIIYSSAGKFYYFKIGVMICFFIFDFYLAYSNRSKNNLLCDARNRKVIAKFNNDLSPSVPSQAAIDAEDGEINKYEKRSRNFLYGLLLISVIKIIIFLMDIKGTEGGIFSIKGYFIDENPWLLFIPIIYLIIALCHWEYFGNWFNTWQFHQKFNDELKLYKKGLIRNINQQPIHFSAINRTDQIILNPQIKQIYNINNLNEYKIENVKFKITKHSLKNDNTNSDIYHTNCSGILTDSDCHILASNQNTAMKISLVGINFLKLQVYQISQQQCG